MTNLNAGVAPMMMGVLERGKGTACLLGNKSERIVEYWVYKMARSGTSPASRTDRDGMTTSNEDQ